MNWLLGALINLVDVSRGKQVGKIDSRLDDVPRGLACMVRLFGGPMRWCHIFALHIHGRQKHVVEEALGVGNTSGESAHADSAECAVAGDDDRRR